MSGMVHARGICFGCQPTAMPAAFVEMIRVHCEEAGSRPEISWPAPDNLRAREARETGDPNASTFFGSANDMLDTIDAVEHDGLE